MRENTIQRSSVNQEEASNNPEGLTLPLSTGDQPFALSDEEKCLSADDWAWLFLSLNEDYRAAYADYRNRYNLQPRGSAPNRPQLSRHVFEADNREMMSDDDGYAARVFGIAAWLSPSMARLPEIANGSWFFPLKRFGSANDFPPKSSDRPHLHRTLRYTKGDSALHPLITENPFGYCLSTKAPLCTPLDVYVSAQRNWILTVIDCRIPPAAQVATARHLANLTRRLLKDSRSRESSDTSPRILIDASHEEVSSYAKLKTATYGANSWANLPEGMHVLAINSREYLASDIAAALVQLNKKHQALVKAKKADRSPLRDLRFKSSLPSSRDKDGVIRDGGSRLKALHVIAELTDRGVSQNQIAQITCTQASSNCEEHTWRLIFRNEISNYIDDATELVTGGYRWLVQAQKNALNATSPTQQRAKSPTFRRSR
jgi:hypothetical protein